MNRISRGTSSLPIQVVALHKHCVVTQTAHPHVSFPFALQLHALPNVQPMTDKSHCCPSVVTPPDVLDSSCLKLFHDNLRGNIPGPLYVLCSVDIAQLTQAEAIPSRRVHVAVHRHDRARRRHLEGLPDLDIHLKVGNGAPVLWSWTDQRAGHMTNGPRRLRQTCGRFSICSSILTGVVGYGGLEGNFIGNGPCKKMSALTLDKELGNHISSEVR